MGEKRVQKVGEGLMGKGGTYRERRCGIADSCGPYLDVCASQRVRSNEMERLWVSPCSVVIEFEERDGEELHVFGNSQNFYGESNV